MKVPFLDVRASYLELKDEIDASVSRVLDSGRYVLGEDVEQFEQEFAEYCGTENAIGVGNGLDALAISLQAAGIGRGDEVLVPAHTFIATWLSVQQCGAQIIPVDVRADDMTMDPSAALAACSPRTAAIVPVHLYGHPADRELERLALARSLLYVGDAAQAHGARVDGQNVGSFGNAAAFSFYPAKNLGALGDAGAITTDDAALAERARRIRNYGSSSKYEFAEAGQNSRLDSLQAAVLRIKLRHLDEWNARRKALAHRYLRELSSVQDLVLPAAGSNGVEPVWHLFCIRHPDRDRLTCVMSKRGVEVQSHYPVPPHLSPAMRHLGYVSLDFPVAVAITHECLSLPIGPHLDEASVSWVVESVQALDG